MPELVLLIGLLVTAASFCLLVRPASLAGLLGKVFGTRWLFGAALLRLFAGAALIGSANTVKFSAAVELFGWLFVLGALLLVVIPGPVLQRNAQWFASLSPGTTRLWLLLSLSFGGWLIYAALS